MQKRALDEAWIQEGRSGSSAPTKPHRPIEQPAPSGCASPQVLDAALAAGNEAGLSRAELAEGALVVARSLHELAEEMPKGPAAVANELFGHFIAQGAFLEYSHA